MKVRGPTEADFERAYGLDRPQVNSVYARTVKGYYTLENDQDVAVFALAHGARPKEAARDAGVPLAVVRSWMQDSAFRLRVEELRRELLEPLRDEIQSSLSDAFHVIRDNMLSGDPKVSQRAAEFVIDRFGQSITDVAVGPQQAPVQINVSYHDLRAEAARRLAEYSKGQPSVIDMEKDDDE